MFQREIKYQLNKTYIHYFNQKNITKLMRSILLDWMIEVQILYLGLFRVSIKKGNTLHSILFC